MRGHLLLTNCLQDELTRPHIELALKEDRLLWLDLQGTDDETLILLREVFKIHPLAVEDVKEFHQRPKIEDYDNFVSIVAYGARELGEPMTEVHCFYAERFLVSVHRDDVPAVTEACHTLGRLHTDRRLDMRKLVVPQRDMVSAMMAQVITIPGMTAESERYVRDLFEPDRVDGGLLGHRHGYRGGGRRRPADPVLAARLDGQGGLSRS